jgi:SsrA-binding protein
MAKKSANKNEPVPHNGHIASNKRARHDYEILEKFEAGLVLVGSEVKTLRQGRATIVDGHITVDVGRNGKLEAWIENISIPPYNHAGNNWTNHADRRTRKLLLHSKEIDKIQRQIDAKGMTAVPLALYFKGGRAKLEIALARGKHLHDKRETIKQRDLQRDADRRIKGF